jgi:ATP-binding cassette subfamily B protein
VARAFGRGVPSVPEPPPDLGRGEGGAAEVARWIGAAARSLDLEGAPVDVRASSLDALLAGGTPLLLAVRPGLLLLTGERREGAVGVLDAQEQVRWAPADDVARHVLGAQPEGSRALAAFTARMGLATAEARARAAAVLGQGRLWTPIQGWALFASERGFWRRVAEVGGLRLTTRAVLGFLAQLALALLAWWVVGRGALEGRLEPGWLWAWGLMLVSMVACQGAASWAAGKLAVHFGGLTKERLLEGILTLPPEEIHSRGVGQLLGSVLEADALAALARAGGPMAVGAVLQLVVGAVVLVLGAAPGLHLVALGLWVAAVALMGARYHRLLVQWADARLSLTHELVESMVGHRTLVAQGRAVAPGETEEALAAYERRGAALDAATARLATLAPRGWLVVGLLGLAPGFVAGQAAPDALAVSLGGVLLVYWACAGWWTPVPL